MKSFKDLSMRTKFLLGTALSVFLLGSTSYYLEKKMSKVMVDRQKIDFQSNAESLGASVAAQFFERYGDVQAFALNPVFSGKNKSEMVEALNNYVALYGIYDLVLFVDKDGSLIASNNKGPDG
jgi:methyl-accepting chemotaxis protein